jgi:hypothetical protein
MVRDTLMSPPTEKVSQPASVSRSLQKTLRSSQFITLQSDGSGLRKDTRRDAMYIVDSEQQDVTIKHNRRPSLAENTFAPLESNIEPAAVAPIALNSQATEATKNEVKNRRVYWRQMKKIYPEVNQLVAFWEIRNKDTKSNDGRVLSARIDEQSKETPSQGGGYYEVDENYQFWLVRRVE